MKRRLADCSTINDFMTREHVCLDNLLVNVSATEVAVYQEFRKSLLGHISIEEKILLPAVQRIRDGTPLPLAGRLRMDHGALAALMMLPPSASTVRAIRTVLAAHNPLEEGSGGVYQQCDEIAAPEIANLLDLCKATPTVPVSPWADSIKVLNACRRALVRAGYDPALLEESSQPSK